MKRFLCAILLMVALFATSFSQSGGGGGGGSGGGAVTSVFGRTGDVAAASADYSFSLIGGFIQTSQLVVDGTLTYSQSNGHLGVDTARMLTRYAARQGAYLSDTTKFPLSSALRQGAFLSDTTKFPLTSSLRPGAYLSDTTKFKQNNDSTGGTGYTTLYQNSLKVTSNNAITGATKTKITYDAKGLVTAGADAGVSDITGLQDSLNTRQRPADTLSYDATKQNLADSVAALRSLVAGSGVTSLTAGSGLQSNGTTGAITMNASPKSGGGIVASSDSLTLENPLFNTLTDSSIHGIKAYISDKQDYTDRQALLTLYRKDTTAHPSSYYVGVDNRIYSRGDSAVTSTGAIGNYTAVIEDTTKSGTTKRKRGLMFGGVTNLVPYTENYPYNTKWDVAGDLYSNLGDYEATAVFYVGGSRHMVATTGNPYSRQWRRMFELDDTVGVIFDLNGGAQDGLDLSGMDWLGDSARAIRTKGTDTSYVGYLGLGYTAHPQHWLSNYQLQPSLALVSTGINTNIISDAAIKDSAAIVFDFSTNTYKPRFTITTTNGNTILNLDTNGVLGIGRVPLEVRLGEKLDLTTGANFGGMVITAWSATASNAPLIDLKRSKSSTIGTHTAVTSGDALGYLTYRGSNGTSFQDAAYIKGEVDGTVSGSAMPGRIAFYTTPSGSNVSTEKLRLTNDGRLYGTALHNNSGDVTGTTTQHIASGTYTPTLTNVTNVAASTAYACQWIRVGNVVTVSGKVDIDATLAASTATELGLSLPIASALTAEEQVGGVASSDAVASLSVRIKADATNDRASFVMKASSLSNDSYNFTFTYVIL